MASAAGGGNENRIEKCQIDPNKEKGTEPIDLSELSQWNSKTHNSSQAPPPLSFLVLLPLVYITTSRLSPSKNAVQGENKNLHAGVACVNCGALAVISHFFILPLFRVYMQLS